MKLSLSIAALILAGQAFGNPSPAQDGIEICVPSGECAIPVYAKGIEGTVYVVASQGDLETLQSLWTAAKFYQTTPEDYRMVKETMTTDSIVLPAVNPGALMERAGRPPAPAPRPAPAQGGGPLVSGSISTGPITIGGGGGHDCSDCHTGSWREIHSGVMQPSKPAETK